MNLASSHLSSSQSNLQSFPIYRSAAMSHRLPPSSVRAIQGLRTRSASLWRSRPTPIPPRAPKSLSHPLRTYSTTRSQIFSSSQRSPKATIAACCLITAFAATYTINHYTQPLHLDAAPSTQGAALTSGAKVELTGQDHSDDVDKVPTGTSSVPYFPQSIYLPRSGASDSGVSPALPAGTGAAQEEEEYQLLGLGIRKVSFLRIQVYVVGFYVAKSDMGRLQEELVRAAVGPGASTLVQGEKEQLRKTLLSGEGSETVWGDVLAHGGWKSAVRIVPTRNTNFGHLRDGWVRGIEARSKEWRDEGFRGSVDAFKGMFGGRGGVGKGRVLLLGRGGEGGLRAWVEEDGAGDLRGEGGGLVTRGGGMGFLGRVEDERVSRAVWTGYLAGDRVASDEARESVVEGIMEIVERPVGTVETQVL